MNLREFISNDPKLNNQFPEEDKLGKEKPKILGIPWNIEMDEIFIDFSVENKQEKITKRNVLRQMASIFDPLGLAVPSLLDAKLFFQSLWEAKKGWDESLEAGEIEKWQEITKVWKIPPIEIERRITITGGIYQLHVFSDASKNAYAACVYLRTEFNDKIMSFLVYARSRLRPKKMPISIPRMELLGVLIGTRAIKFVEEQIRIVISEKYLWCDSKPVLFWIKTGKIDEKFVENRVREIKKNTGLKIGYIQTEDNPADLGTRGCTPEDLRNSTKWWNGPGWIKEPPEYWPNELNFVNEPDLIDEDKPSETVLLTEVKDRDEFIEFSHWNNWHKLVLCISLVIKFTKIWMRKCNFKNSGELLELFDTKSIIRPQETRRTEKIYL
uniref:Uncharacterized protein n=1 Tax=Meloidogyne enterolobii TaxID=390850 RepID=A0A6V7U249_MELEN|nr:unnamed protein product [Meloidogyne enterolobii]